ncbi:MAG: YHS domain-containing (seleno)protein [Paracoccus hibiscisoli]|uniref:YHS domain-containing (seleno)protein n=1 Tax=Paracoccus hibiscisoli TaxID=2023261 RepID=UPI00391B2373
MRALVLSLLLTLVPALPAAAQDWAVGGFDPVGYAQAGRALPGRSDIATMWRGQLWHFSSEENRARFEADPRSYAPALGGMCPVSVVEGRPQPGDPRHFALVGGRLYLLESGAAERRLMKDPSGITQAARQMWRE